MSRPVGWRSGDGALWLSTGAVALTLLMTLALLGLLAQAGFGHFWPKALATVTFPERQGAPPVLAELREQSAFANAEGELEPRWLLRTGNRDWAAPDFRWVPVQGLGTVHFDPHAVELERRSWGPARAACPPGCSPGRAPRRCGGRADRP